jgi:hypothetical protein
MKKIAISKLSIVGDCLLQIASVFWPTETEGRSQREGNFILFKAYYFPNPYLLLQAFLFSINMKNIAVKLQFFVNIINARANNWPRISYLSDICHIFEQVPYVF